MADESIDSSLTPEKSDNAQTISISSSVSSASLSNGVKTRANHRSRRASLGSHRVGENSMRNLAEKSDSANSAQNVVPHYLRASTGSCHDFCKYGKKHSAEEKARKPFRKWIPKPLLNEHPIQIFVSGGQKKEKVVNHKSPIDTKNHSPDLKPSPDIKSNPPKPKISSGKKKVIKNKLSTDAKIQPPDLPFTAKKTYFRKPKISPGAKTYSPKKNPSSENKLVLPKYNKSSSTEKSPSPDPPEIVKSVFFPSENVEDPIKQTSSTDDKMSRAEKKTTYLSKQRSSPVKSKPAKAKPSSSFSELSKPVKAKPLSSSPDNSDGIRGKGKINIESKTGRNMTPFKASTKKKSVLPVATLSPKLPVIKTSFNNSRKSRNVKSASHLKDKNRTRRVYMGKASNNEEVSEKILHVIKTETENNVIVESTTNNQAISSQSSSKPQTHEKSSSLSSSHKEVNEETEYSDEIMSDNVSLKISKLPPPVKENHNKALKKIKVVVAEESKSRSPVKLKFRNGKIMDVQSNNNSPRRLRFRRARVIGPEEGKGDLRRRIFKKAAVNNDVGRAEVSSEKIVLKHQNVQGKKDARGLFNNVIEETASKLVESRKSKVKALVGAFETVISLQESKPSSQAVG